jgi:hypothetical protein
VAATLRLTRKGTIMELRRGTFSVLLDDGAIGSIKPNQTIELTIDPGHHTLQVKVGRYSGPGRPFDAADGEIINFRCYGGRIWPIFLASLVKPDLALTLKRE